MNIVMLIVYFILTVSGVILMKLGASSPLSIGFKDGFSFSIGFLSFLGYTLYIFSFFLWTRIVLKFDLSYIVPICTGIVQILTITAAIIILKEQFRVTSIFGAILIIAGIVLLNIKK